ncbi:phosphoribosylformylglycinamidine cyclo-ligase [Planctomycetota bacterium]|nr:phosphoribosylformylglycinamidine cyclo-ligase [Planctomycetota bacterium]
MASNKSSKKALTYAEAGVDIEAGDAVVGRIKSHMRNTYGPRVLGKHGAFAGCFRLDNNPLFERNYKEPVLVSGTDGVGTKVLLAIELKSYDTIGQDCVAMNVNDMIVQGAEPLFFLDYVGINKVVPEQMEQIVKGVADGCNLAGCALLGGETAEMADVYKPGDFDLAGFSVGVVELSQVIDGSRVQEGDIILGITSSGIHSNGYTLVRKIIEHANLDITKVYPELDESKTLGQILLEPTRIYSKSVCAVLQSFEVDQPISGMAHITGGGLPGNVNRALPEELDAEIKLDTWTIPPIFKFLQKHGNVDTDEMYRVFNMGIGYTMIVRPDFAKVITEKLQSEGETVIDLGEIIKGSGKVQLG